MKRFFALFVILALFVTMLGITVFSAPAKVTLKIGDTIPDRKSPRGLVLEEINAQFKAKHPNVEIVTESYQDQAYQQKIKIYAAADQLPDVFKYWSFKNMLGELAKNDYLLALNPKSYAKLGFLPGALESCTYFGKTWGLPESCDFWMIYYNKALFAKYNVKVPTTLDELVAAAKVLRSNGVIPVVTDGKDSWPLAIMFTNLVDRTAGDFTLIQKALDRKIKFTDPAFLAAANKFKELIDQKVFADDLVTSDYGASRNLFGQEKAAMYMMGSWETGLATDTNFSENFRNNVSVFKFPAGPKGSINNLTAWYGGCYVVSAKTKHKALALDYLKTFYTLYPKLIWENKAAVPAQVVKTSAQDNQLSKDAMAILGSAKKTSGTTVNDLSTPEFKNTCEKLSQELAAGVKTPEQFLKALDEAAAKAAEAK